MGGVNLRKKLTLCFTIDTLFKVNIHIHLTSMHNTHTHKEDDGEEGDEDLMQNPEFLHSILSSLPGVNPEEALHNLEQMKDQQKEQDKVSKAEEWLGVCDYVTHCL